MQEQTIYDVLDYNKKTPTCDEFTIKPVKPTDDADILRITNRVDGRYIQLFLLPFLKKHQKGKKGFIHNFGTILESWKRQRLYFIYFAQYSCPFYNIAGFVTLDEDNNIEIIEIDKQLHRRGIGSSVVRYFLKTKPDMEISPLPQSIAFWGHWFGENKRDSPGGYTHFLFKMKAVSSDLIHKENRSSGYENV